MTNRLTTESPNRDRQRILLTGRTGQIGWELQRTLAPPGEVIALDRHQLDLANPDQICERVRAIRPHLIINAAAYTAVDQAESEPERAMAINGIAPGILAEEAKRLNAAIVHYSTDYVFDGAGTTPYSEADRPNPQNIYGRTKLEGERAIQAVGIPHLILRSSWIYSLRGKNFLLTILRHLREGKPLRIVNDQTGSPTWSRMVAEATAHILAASHFSINDKQRTLADVSGLYHVTAGGQTSWYGFAEAIADHWRSASTDSSTRPQVTPIPTSEFPTPATRPAFSALSNERLHTTFGLRLPSWEAQLVLCMA